MLDRLSVFQAFPLVTKLYCLRGFCAHFVRTKADQARVGFPHSDICGSKLICQLPAAFRRLSRLSSPVIAKAFTTCTYSLDPITLSPQPFRGQGLSSQVFFRLAFVTVSIRLEWSRFNTIKTHVFHAFTSGHDESSPDANA